MKSISGNSFEVGAKVIVDWRGCFYQAKIVRKNTSRTDNKHYFVHFNGWSSNHDEWKCLDVIYPLTDENQKTLEEHHEFIKQQRNTKTTGKGKRKADDSDDKKAKKEKRDRSEKSDDKSVKSDKSGDSVKLKSKLSEKSTSDKSKTDESKVGKLKISKSEKSEKPSSEKLKPEKTRSKPVKIKNSKSSDEVSKINKLKHQVNDKTEKPRNTEIMPPPKKDVRKYIKRSESENFSKKATETKNPLDSKLTDSNLTETTSSRRNRTSSFSSNVSTAVSTASNNSATTTQTVVSTRTSRSARSEMVPLPATPNKSEEENSKLIDTYIKNKDNCLVYVGKTSKDIKSLKDLKNVKNFKDGTIDKTLVQNLTSGQNFATKPSNLGPEMKREDTASISNSTISQSSGAAPVSNWLEEYKTAYNTGEIEQIYWEGEIVMIKSADNGKPKVGEITEAIQSRTTKKLKYRVQLKNDPERDLGLLDHSDLSKLGGELRPRKRTSNQGTLNQSFGHGQGISPGASSQKGDKTTEKMSPKKERAASIKHVSPLAKNDKTSKNLSRTFETKTSESQSVDQPSSHEIVHNWYNKLDPNNMSNDSSSELERESSVNSPLVTANSQVSAISQGSSISQVLHQNIQNSNKNSSIQNPSTNNPSNQNPSVQNTSNENSITITNTSTADNESNVLTADSTISPSTTSPTSAINSGAKRNSTARRQEKLQSLIRTHFQEPVKESAKGKNGTEIKTKGKRSDSESRVDAKTEGKTEVKRESEKKKPGKKGKHKFIPVLSRVGSERTTFNRQKSKNSVKPLIPSYFPPQILTFLEADEYRVYTIREIPRMGKNYLKYSVHHVLSQFVCNEYDVLSNEGAMAIEYTKEFEALFNKVLPEQLMYRLEFGRLRDIYIIHKRASLEYLKNVQDPALSRDQNQNQKRNSIRKNQKNTQNNQNEELQIAWSFEVSAPYLARYCFLMAQMNEEESVKGPDNDIVEEFLSKLLRYLVVNKEKFLGPSNYDAVSPEYFRLMC